MIAELPNCGIAELQFGNLKFGNSAM